MSYEKEILFEKTRQSLLELIGDFLDSQEFIIDCETANLIDPESRSETELHIRMADAAIVVLKNTLIEY